MLLLCFYIIQEYLTLCKMNSARRRIVWIPGHSAGVVFFLSLFALGQSQETLDDSIYDRTAAGSITARISAVTELVSNGADGYLMKSRSSSVYSAAVYWLLFSAHTLYEISRPISYPYMWLININ